MKVLIVGGGGREHALAWKCAQSERVHEVFVAPGNAGTALEPKVRNVGIPADDIEALLEFATREDIALTIVGPEGPLVAGIVDRFAAAGRACFGPSRASARLEGSKAFTKEDEVSDEVVVEPNFPAEKIRALEAFGHMMRFEGVFGSAQSIAVTPQGLVGAADQRARGATAAGY